MTPLDAETLVAALGLDRILAGTPSMTRAAQEASVTFPKRARALLLKALSNRDPEPDGEDMPPFDYDEVSKLLTADDDTVMERTNALYDALPDDVQDDVEAAATRATAHLQSIQPRRITKTTARVEVSPPEPFELDRFARAWRVAVDPMWALRMMAVGGLDMVMVDALAAAYPSIYALVSGRVEPGGAQADVMGLLDDAIATMKERRGEKWDVTDDQDRQVKILIGEEPIDLDLANDFAELSPRADAPPPKPRGAKALEPTAELLPGQKSA